MDFVDFGFSSWRQAPDVHGVYCWRYRPRIEKGHLKKIIAEMESVDNASDRGQVLYANLESLLISPFSRPAYNISLGGKLLPSYVGQVNHKLPDVSAKFESMASDIDSLPELINYLNSLYELVSTPFYIGIAIKQTLRARIRSHVQAVERYKTDRRFSDEDDEESQNLAARIVERKLNPSCLWISCLPMPHGCQFDITNLEFIMNRTINPILGRN